MSLQIDRVHTLAATRPPSFPRLRPTSPHDDRQSQLELALKRSVTLIIWYRSNCDPIRLTHEISTFPLFSLAHYPSVVSDLELTPASYVDAYNGATGHWEQHLITTVRVIETEQRLLYKLRKSLLAGLPDEECTGLAEEVALQAKKSSLTHPPSSPQFKRPLGDAAEAPSAKRLYFPESYPAPVYIPPPMSYMLPTQAMPYTPLASPPLSTHSPPRTETETVETTTSVSSPAQPTMNLPSPTPLCSPKTPNTATRSSFSQHPHPPLKRWPNDYTVSEIAAGFRAMDGMVAQSPAVTQKAAFERVFGRRYVKSTVCRHRGVYRRADIGVRSFFEEMGNDEQGVWGEFVKRVEGRKGMESDENGEAPTDSQVSE